MTRNGAKDKVPPVGARTRQARRTTVELWRLQGGHAIRAEIEKILKSGIKVRIRAEQPGRARLANYFVRLITP